VRTALRDDVVFVPEETGHAAPSEYTSPLLTTLGNRIRDLRLDRGLSLDKLANASGLSKGSLSSIEHGLVNITVETCAKIARGLDVVAASLLLPREAERGSSASPRRRGGRQ
jgi:transcriptional regulator with XRE-family HTH domain